MSPARLLSLSSPLIYDTEHLNQLFSANHGEERVTSSPVHMSHHLLPDEQSPNQTGLVEQEERTHGALLHHNTNQNPQDNDNNNDFFPPLRINPTI